MSGDTTSVDFDEPFTLISSSAEKLGSKVSGKGIMGHINAGKEWIVNKHSGVQPWSEFLNVRKIAIPKSLSQSTSRLLSNLNRFQSNYLFVSLGLVIYCIITNPTLLFALGFCLGSWWFISVKNKSENINLLGRETSAKELYAAVTLISIPLFYFAGAGSTVFWIIGASIVLVMIHAILMATPSSGQTVDEELGIVMEEVTVS